MPYLRIGLGLRVRIELRIERPTISVAFSWRVIYRANAVYYIFLL